MASSVNVKELSGECDQDRFVPALKQMVVHAIFLNEMEQLLIAIKTLQQFNVGLNWRARMKEPAVQHGSDFYSPLCFAISLGRHRMVGVLLANGADPNLCSTDDAKKSTGRTALHEATRFRQFHILNFLLESGCWNIDKCDAKGWTILNIAISLDDISTAMRLLDLGANPNEQLTISSRDVTTSNRHSIHSVLKRYDWCLTRPSEIKWNSLHLAAHCHQPEIVARLLGEFFAKEDVNLQSSLGTTPLHEAVVLPEHYNVQDLEKSERRYKTIEILLHSGISPSVGDNKGRTALHLFLDEINSMRLPAKSCILMVTSTLQLVLKQSHNPNTQDQDGRTLAHQTAIFGNVDVMKLLLSFGANCTCKDMDGNTPAHVAAYHGQFEMLSFLIRSGNFIAGDINNNGNTVFHAALTAKRKDVDITEMSGLLQNYFDAKVRNAFGETVYDLACKFYLGNTAKCLAECGNEREMRKECSNCENREQEMHSFEKEKEPALEKGVSAAEVYKRRGTVPCADKKVELKIDEETNVVEYLLDLCEKKRMGEIHMDAEELCHERCEIARQTKSLVQELLNLVGSEDERFASEVLCTGSAFEGYRISKPDEFDFMCELVSLSKGACEMIESDTPGFVRIRISEDHSKDWEMFTDENGLLDSSKIRLYLGEALQKVSKSIEISSRYNLLYSTTCYDRCKFCKPLIQLSKAGIKMAAIWNGIKHPMMLIDIDVTPSIHFMGWPKCSKRPSPHVLGSCQKDVGYHVIPKQEGNDPSLWRLSFSIVELEILQNASVTQGACYTSLKIIKDTTLGLSAGEYSHLGNLHTYMLKTKFFEELEKSCDPSMWSKNQLVNRICSILQSIAEGLSQRGDSRVESFFLPGFNVINVRDKMLSRLASASIKETVLAVIKLLKKEKFTKPEKYFKATGFTMHFQLDKEEKKEYSGEVIFE